MNRYALSSEEQDLSLELNLIYTDDVKGNISNNRLSIRLDLCMMLLSKENLIVVRFDLVQYTFGTLVDMF